MTKSLILTTSVDPFTRGLDYLYGVRSLALDPDMVSLVYDLTHRIPACTWIGQHIEAINLQLNIHLQACHECFHPWERPVVQIFAAPLDQSFGLDALCNFQTQPLTILIDVGRVAPEDWLFLVVHEYAHAQAGYPGHHQPFADSLAHVCLGLGIALPPIAAGTEDNLRFYPGCLPTPDPLRFWLGGGEDSRSPIPNSEFPTPDSDGISAECDRLI